MANRSGWLSQLLSNSVEFKGCALPPSTRARPETPSKIWRLLSAMQIDVDEDNFPWLLRPPPARELDPFRELFLLQLASDVVMSGVSHIGQPIAHAENK